jgi:hypothetical protein
MGIRKCRTSVAIAVTGALVSVTCTAGVARAAGGPAGRSCSPAQLAVSDHGIDGGLSHDGSVVVFTDRGGPCTMRGYPNLVGTRNGRVVVRARHTSDGYLGGPGGVQSVRLATGKSASAMYEGLGAEYEGGPPCQRYTRLLVTPPGAAHAMRLPRRNPDYAICYLEIHPVVAGTSGAEGGVG